MKISEWQKLKKSDDYGNVAPLQLIKSSELSQLDLQFLWEAIQVDEK